MGLRASTLLIAALAGLGATADASPASEPRQPVVAVLEEVDFIHRTGRCRTCLAGEIVEFALAPDAANFARTAMERRGIPARIIGEVVPKHHPLIEIF